MCHAELANPPSWPAIICRRSATKSAFQDNSQLQNTILCPCLKHPERQGRPSDRCAMELANPPSGRQLSWEIGDQERSSRRLTAAETPTSHASNVRAIWQDIRSMCHAELANPPSRPAITCRRSATKSAPQDDSQLQNTILCPCLKRPSDKAGQLIDVPWS